MPNGPSARISVWIFRVGRSTRILRKTAGKILENVGKDLRASREICGRNGGEPPDFGSFDCFWDTFPGKQGHWDPENPGRFWGSRL
jgi:hypothetical protein